MNTHTLRPPPAGVSLTGLEKAFRGPQGTVRAVRGVDLDIAPGETVALLGPNGAGKSTTIDMMLGLLPPDAGWATLFGGEPSAAVRSGAVGAMLQTGSLIRDIGVREIVEMMASLYPHPRDVDEVLALAGLRDVAGRRTQKLSGGQSQRVRLALALVSDPDLLVLDEPTVAMDVEGRHGFWEIMRGLAARGTTSVFATHYLEEADAYADRIVLMATAAWSPTAPRPRSRRAWGCARSGRPCRAPTWAPSRAWTASRRSTGAATPWCWSAPTGTAPSGRCSPPSRAPATSRSAARASRRPSCA